MAEQQERIREIRERCERATPGPWGWNSYRLILSTPLIQGEEDAPEYPETPRPGPPFFTDSDNAWLAQRDAAYEADPVVAWVPAHYGDTATGRHADDADFIAHSRKDVPFLLDVLARSEARVAELESADSELARLREAGDDLVCALEALLIHFRRHTSHQCEIDRDADMALDAEARGEALEATTACADLLVRLVRPMYAGPTGDQGINDPLYGECLRAINRYRRSRAALAMTAEARGDGLREAIAEALYDYDHGDELSAVDRLRAALAGTGAAPVVGGGEGV